MAKTSIWLSIRRISSSRDIDRRMSSLAQEKETGAQERLIEPVGRMPPGRGQQVAGNLLDHELVVGEVGVQGANHVIAIAEGVQDVVIELMPGRLGKPGQVEPVAAPPLAVVGAGQQPVDEVFVGVRRAVGQEGSDLAGVGGRPVRSNVRRRIKVRRSASGAGVNPRSSMAASRNRSIGFRGQPRQASLTAGGEFGWIGWKHQCRALRANSPGTSRAINGPGLPVAAASLFLRGRNQIPRPPLPSPTASAWRSPRRAASTWAASGTARHS